jgi:DNA anti-recombination protein RmuC
LRTTEAGRNRTERRERAAAEVKDLLARLYRSFVLWGSLYEVVDRSGE